MNNLGTLTRKQFNDEITKFTKKSEVLNENWSTRQMEVCTIDVDEMRTKNSLL